MHKNFSDLACPLLGSLTVSGILIFSHNQVLAQVTPDDTLGNESSVVNPRNATSESIDGGAIRGQNLFHSFQEFNVGEDRGVYFTNPDAVTNIFSRVTGNDVSNILGTLGVDGAANLFLINPNGIIFGEGASLDVQGSFAATTADGIEFGEQGFFSASDPESPNLLTINPSAYLFNQVAPGAIANNSQANDNIGLQVQPGKSLSLIGGDVSLNGGIIKAPAGNVQLGGLSAVGTIDINSNGSLSFPKGLARSNVFLTQEAFVDASGTEGGNITVNAGDLEISSNSELQTGTFADIGLPEGQSGDIILNATGAVEIDASTLDAGVEIGNAGDIEIRATSFSLTNVGKISNSTFGQGNAGNVTISTNNSVQLSNADIFSNVEAGAEGKGGQIKIDTGNLYLKAGAQIQTIVRKADKENSFAGGIGDAGNIVVNARGNVAINGVSNDDNQYPSGLISTVGSGAKGNGGNIEINAANLSLTKSAELSSSISGIGNAGNITVNVGENIFLNTGEIFSNVGSGAKGNGGNIEINAANLFLTNDGAITNSTFGKGNAGNIIIDATENFFLDTGGIFSNVGNKDVSQAEGNAGEITISGNLLSLTNGAQIQSGVWEGNLGNGNNVTLNAKSDVTISSSDQGKSSGIFTDVEQDVLGNAGNININAQGSILLNNAVIKNTNVGTGFAGDINLDAPNEISIKDSQILSEGNFGRIFIGNLIQPSRVKLEGSRTENDSEFPFSNRLSTTNSNPEDLAGSITINARDSIDVTGSAIEGKTETTRTTNINEQDGLNFSTIKLKVAEQNPIGTITINQSEISTTNFDIGFSGDVMLNARKNIQVLDTSIFSRGNLGRILIGKSDVSGETTSPQEINFSNSSLEVSNASVENAPERQIDAGDISINAINNIFFVNNSKIRTVTERLGDAGDLIVSSENSSVFLDKSNVFSNVNPGGIGNAGDINITALNSISFTNGAELQSGIVDNIDNNSIIGVDKINDNFLDSNPSGRGNGGNITLNARESITLSDSNALDIQDGSGIFTEVEKNAIGNAGNIKLTTGLLFLTDKAKLTTESLGFGNAGKINIIADSITLDRNSSIFASNTPSGDISKNLSGGNGGNINFQINDQLALRNNSDISTKASINANGGNINIIVDTIIAFDDSDIFASAADGQGGDINLNTPAYFAENFTLNSLTRNPDSLDNNSRADLNATGAVPGVVSIPDVSFIQNGLNNLPDNSINTDELVANSCVSPVGKRQEGKFIITGTGGLPVAPGNDEIADFATGEVRNVPSNNSGWQRGDAIVEPQGVYRLTSGKLVMSRECNSQ